VVDDEAATDGDTEPVAEVDPHGDAVSEALLLALTEPERLAVTEELTVAFKEGDEVCDADFD